MFFVSDSDQQGIMATRMQMEQVKEADKWSFKSKIWKPKISSFVIKNP